MLRPLAVLFRAVPVSAVERVVRSGDEGFSPFDERGGEETSDHANNDFVDEGRVHSFFEADAMPLLHQKPHCRVCMIHKPRSRLVRA